MQQHSMGLLGNYHTSQEILYVNQNKEGIKQFSNGKSEMTTCEGVSEEKITGMPI